MAILAILQADARVAARLSAALSSDHEVVVRPSWDSLERTLATEDFDGCLVDAHHPDPETATREIRRLLDAHPELAVMAMVESTHGPGYYRLGGMGVAGVLASRAEPAVKTRAAVDHALATARADAIARALEGRYPAPGPAAVAWAVEHAGPDTSVRKLAQALGHTPKSLRDALEAAGLPAPTRVLLWGRLLLAGARLGSDGRTVEDVAFSLGYSTATSLARAMKQQTGLTPGQVSVRGGMRRVRDALFPPESETERAGGGLGKIAVLALLSTLGGCAVLGSGGTGVDRGAIDEILDREPMSQAHFGVLVEDVRTGKTLYEHNGRRWFVPASNQKILVTAAAWSLLGPDYRYVTELWAAGPVRGGVLEGDLVLVGSGDPSLSSRYWPSGASALGALADSARAAGLVHVRGALVVDVSAWDSTTVGPSREVEDLRFAYGATGGAFAIDEGELRVVVRGRPPIGGLARVDWSPVGQRRSVESLVRTAAPGSGARVVAHYLPESRRLVLDGYVEYGTVDTAWVAQRDPVRHAAAVLAGAVQGAGVRVDRGWEVAWSEGDPLGGGCLAGRVRKCPSSESLARIESPSLAELTAGVLEPSQNWLAEQLVRTLGAERGEHGSWSEGISVLEAFLRDEVRVDSLDVAARDGSGLSAYNLVTPRAITRVLRYMAARPDGLAYRDAMAEPGEENSTLEDRLATLEGRLYAKTGTISNVNALSGYLVRDGGEEVAFSILTNGAGVGASQVREAIDSIVHVLSR